MMLRQPETKPCAQVQAPFDAGRITGAERAFLWQMLSASEGPVSLAEATRRAEQLRFRSRGALC